MAGGGAVRPSDDGSASYRAWGINGKGPGSQTLFGKSAAFRLIARRRINKLGGNRFRLGSIRRNILIENPSEIENPKEHAGSPGVSLIFSDNRPRTFDQPASTRVRAAEQLPGVVADPIPARDRLCGHHERHRDVGLPVHDPTHVRRPPCHGARSQGCRGSTPGVRGRGSGGGGAVDRRRGFWDHPGLMSWPLPLPMAGRWSRRGGTGAG